MTTLKDIGIGQSATVIRLRGEGAVRKHIMHMGVTKGCTVRLRRVAPLGDPVEIDIRGYRLTLRRSEAELVEVSLE